MLRANLKIKYYFLSFRAINFCQIFFLGILYIFRKNLIYYENLYHEMNYIMKWNSHALARKHLTIICYWNLLINQSL